MTEDQLEQETLSWLTDVGYNSAYGPDIAMDGNAPERSNYTQVVLVERFMNWRKIYAKVPVWTGRYAKVSVRA